SRPRRKTAIAAPLPFRSPVAAENPKDREAPSARQSHPRNAAASPRSDPVASFAPPLRPPRQRTLQRRSRRGGAKGAAAPPARAQRSQNPDEPVPFPKPRAHRPARTPSRPLRLL